MPTYDYVCDACQYKFEVFQGIKDAVRRKCPECGKQKLRRLIGAGGGFLFKGSGFYITDYRSDSYKQGAESERKTNESKDKGSGDKGSGDKGSGDKGSGDKGSGDKGSGDKGSSGKGSGGDRAGGKSKSNE